MIHPIDLRTPQDTGASSSEDRAATPSEPSPAVSGKAGIPCAEHTPLPWEAHIQRSKKGDDLGWIVEFDNGRIAWASLAYADTNREAAKDDPAREANARLIAAAPELYAALQEAVSYVDEQKCSPWLGRALRALAKARGAS